MDQQWLSHLRATAARLYEQARARFVRLPATAQVLVGVLLLVGFLFSLHLVLFSKDSRLRLKVQHSFRSADLTVWVDGHRACSVALHGSVRKKFGLIPDSVQGSLTQSVPVSSGHHEVRVRVQSDEDTQEDSLLGDFTANSERTLTVSARHGGVSLAWQNAAAEEPVSTGGSWLKRSMGAVLLTIIGSMISALTGFALRELPGYLRTRAQNGAQSPAAGR